MFPNLSDSGKRAVGIVINNGNPNIKPIHYIDKMIKTLSDKEKTTRDFLEYFNYNPNQVFIMPEASREMEKKSFDFEDKDKMLDFIKTDQIINAKLEFHPFEKQVIKLLQFDFEYNKDQ